MVDMIRLSEFKEMSKRKTEAAIVRHLIYGTGLVMAVYDTRKTANRSFDVTLELAEAMDVKFVSVYKVRNKLETERASVMFAPLDEWPCHFRGYSVDDVIIDDIMNICGKEEAVFGTLLPMMRCK